MVALALGACSNATEEATTSTEANSAKFSFSISMPAGSSSTSRSGSATIDQNGADGTAQENHLENVSIKLVYNATAANPTATVLTKTYANADFIATNETSAQSETGKTITYTLKDASKWEVPAGSAKVYAVVNGAMVETNAVITGNYGNDLNGLTTSGSIAESNKFMMSGSYVDPTNASNTDLTINAGETTTAIILVNRVAAKIQETSATDFTASDLTKVGQKDGADLVSAKTFSVKLTGYSLFNLNNNSYVFPKENFANYNVAVPAEYASVSAYTNFFNAYHSNTVTYPANLAIGTSSIYCMENNNANIPTKVIYAAQVKVDGIDANSDLYVKGNVIYSYTQLVSAVGQDFLTQWGLDSTKGYSEWLKAGIVKYTGGVCYYIENILTATSDAKILRNNWYKLNVHSISGLGLPVPDPAPVKNPTYLKLNIQVQPWTVNANSFDL